MATGTDVYVVARSLVGTPYQHQGRAKDIGIDCIGVPIFVAHKLGLGEFHAVDYPRIPDGRIKPLIEQVCHDEILQPGVLLLFRIGDAPQHCGIVSKYNEGLGLIHAWDVAGMVVEHKLSRDWINKVVGCYALPGVHYDKYQGAISK